MTLEQALIILTACVDSPEGEEALAYVKGCLILPGWTCRNPRCRLFNSDEKERLEFCRGCDLPRDLGLV